MAIAHTKNSGQAAQQPDQPPLRIVFFEESAASFFEMAVDHFLGFDLVTEREFTRVESARRMGGHEVPTARQ
jgi:hypothetical protein